GGIRTHGTVKRYTGFRDRPFQPLRHPSGSHKGGGSSGAPADGWAIGVAPSLRNGRRSWKNSVRISPHSAARTPTVTAARWLSRGSETRRYKLEQAPALGS